MSWVTDDIGYVARSLGLKKSGSEYKGPCPNPSCGGTDRFHIQRGRVHPILMYCRHGCDFATLAKEMHNRGLMSESEYDQEEYRRQKREEALNQKRFTLSVYESAVKRGDYLTYRERMEHTKLRNYINVVDSRH